MEKKLFSITEAAKYLKVTESVISEMATKGIFETKTSGKSKKIVKASMDDWLNNLNEQDTAELSTKKTICRFREYFRPECIFLDFEAANKYEAIRIMSENARALKLVKDGRWLYEVVVAREELVSTAVGKGVALLHPRHVHPTKVKTPTVLFGRCPKGVDFDSLDEKPVTLFFMLLLHDDKQHLFSLAYLSNILKNEENVKILNETKDPEMILKILSDV